MEKSSSPPPYRAFGPYYSAILSVLMPGAGQLFGRRLKPAVIFFTLFAVCLCSENTVGGAFLVALVAGVECLSRERTPSPFYFDRRFFIYLVVCMLGFLCWFFTLGGLFLFGPRGIPEAHAANALGTAGGAADLVDIKRVDFTIHVDMVFAGTANVSGKALLPENRCILRRGVAEALARVQATLKLRGMSLKMRDCYHPLSFESKFREWISDAKGGAAFASPGNPLYRGAAFDALIVQADGQELTLPGKYFWAAGEVELPSKKAGRGRVLTGATLRKAKSNVRALKNAMQHEGFIQDSQRWWRFRYNTWEQFLATDLAFSEIP